jgi:hypothetical protein
MWLERFEPEKPRTRRMSTIAQQVRELQRLTPAELTERYIQLFGKPPRVRNKAFLQRQVAWKLQERALGGLSDHARARLDEIIAKLDVRLAPPEPRARQATPRDEPRPPLEGTTLTREWHGQQIRVEVRENGFEWNGTLFRSLSGIARAITGANWNGRLFFGLTKRVRGR